mgnify:CR=1 FL=1
MRIKGFFYILVFLLLALGSVLLFLSSQLNTIFFYIGEGLILFILIYLTFFYRKIVKPLNTIGSGMELLREQDFSILLLGKWYLNHYHSELFTYHLWVEKFKDEDIFFEGFCKEYAWQKRSDISPHISIKDFSYKHNKYSIEIYTVLNANHDFDKFQLTFGFNNENKFDYPDEIIEILKELGIENEDETVNWFSWYCKSENSILSKTKYLADALFQLKQKK